MKNAILFSIFFGIVLLGNNVSAGIHFTESFTTNPFSPTAYTDGSGTFSSGTWEYMQIKAEISANSYGATGSAARLNRNITSTGSYIITPAVNTIGTVSFWYRELNTGGGTITIQKSVDGGAFTTIGTQTYSGTSYNQYTVTVNELSNNVRIKILSLNNPGFLIVDEVTITDYALGPVLSVNPTGLSGFNYMVGSGPSPSQSYSLTGTDLSGYPGAIIVSAPANYEISTDDISYASNLNIGYTSSSLSATIYVRLKSGLPVSTYNNELVSNSGGGATTATILCNGYVSEIPPAILSVNTFSLTGFTYVVGAGPSPSQSIVLSGSNLTGFPGNISVAAPLNYEISEDNSSFSNSLTLPFSTNTLNPVTIHIRLKAGLSVGTYDSEEVIISGGGATNVAILCSGNVTDVLPPQLVVNPDTLSGFVYVDGNGPSVSYGYSISGDNLTGYPGNIVVTAPVNYEISDDNVSFSSAINLPFSSSSVGPYTIYVRLKAGLAIGLYINEIITNIGGGTSINLICNGEVKEISPSCATDLFISEYHEPAAGNNKGVELYNGTGLDIDLSEYYIGYISNGGTDIETSLALSGILGDQQTACIYNDTDADPLFRLKGDINIPWGSATWNGDDAIYLLKGGNTSAFIIDAIGDMPPVTDPGSEFINNGISTLNTCLIRQNTIMSPTTNWTGTEWTAITAGTYSDWGIHTLDCTSNSAIDPSDVSEIFAIYPNPNHGEFIVSVSEKYRNYSLVISDVLGKIIYKTDAIKTELSLNEVPGIYIIYIFNEEEKISRRFIINP